MLMGASQNLFTKYWISVVTEKRKNTYMYTKIHICLEKSEYHNRFFPFALRCPFTFPCLVICWNVRNLVEICFRTTGFN